MKRLFLAVCLIAAVGVISAETKVVVRDLKGKVEVKALGKDWASAKDGMVIDLLTTVSTGFDSSATLFIGDNRVAVAPLTRLTVDKIVEKAGAMDTSLHLRVGKVSAEVKSSAGIAQDFKVTSPYSTASVRGTKFTYNGLSVEVKEGKVAFILGRPKRDIVIRLPPKAVPTPTAIQGPETFQADDQEATSSEEGGGGEAAAGESTTEEAGAESPSPEDTLQGLIEEIQAAFPEDTFSVESETEGSDEGGAQGSEGTTETPTATQTQTQTGTQTQTPTVFVEVGGLALITENFSASSTGGQTGGSVTTTSSTGVTTTTTTSSDGTGTGDSGTTTGESSELPSSTTVTTPTVTPTTGTIKIQWIRG